MPTRDELQRLSDAATPGTWDFNPGVHGDPFICQKGRGHFGAVAMCSTGPDDYGRGNARFIVALVNAFRAGELVAAEPGVAVPEPGGE